MLKNNIMKILTIIGAIIIILVLVNLVGGDLIDMIKNHLGI